MSDRKKIIINLIALILGIAFVSLHDFNREAYKYGMVVFLFLILLDTVRRFR